MNRIAIGATALALPLLTSVGPAIAQSTVYTTVAYAGLNKDCSPGPLPEIRVTQNPKHGAFVIHKGKASARGEGRCPAGTKAEVQVVFYQSNANYVGDDSVSYEVRSGDQVHSYSIALSIKASAAPRKRPDTTDL